MKVSLPYNSVISYNKSGLQSGLLFLFKITPVTDMKYIYYVCLFCCC